MSVSIATRPTPSRPSRKGKEKDAPTAPNPQNARLKVVIRHLPPLLKEADFRTAIEPVIDVKTCDFFSWETGKMSRDINKPSRPSRCYIKLKNIDQIDRLSDLLRSIGSFSDTKGNSSIPQLEYAPFQKVPKKSSRIDSRANTIDTDPEFQAFLASLNPATARPVDDTTAEKAPAEKAGKTETGGTGNPEVDEKPAKKEIDYNKPLPIPANDPLSAPMPSGEKPEKPTSTPLIEYIRLQKSLPKSGKNDKSSEKSSGSRGATRAERRLREKDRRKDSIEKKDTPEPTALLKRTEAAKPRPTRQGSVSISSSALGPSSPKGSAVKEVAEKPEKERRERRRGANPGVAAILQRDLGLGPRRTRAPKPSTGEASSTPASPTVLSCETTTQGATVESKPAAESSTRTRPSRRERRQAKLEREEAASGGNIPPTPTLRNRTSSNLSNVSLPPTPILMKRDSVPAQVNEDAAAPSSSIVPKPPSQPLQATSATPAAPPTGPAGHVPRGGRFQGPRGGRGLRGGPVPRVNIPPASQQNQNTNTPQSPAGESTVASPTTLPQRPFPGPRGRGAVGHRGFRGGRGRGGMHHGARVGVPAPAPAAAGSNVANPASTPPAAAAAPAGASNGG